MAATCSSTRISIKRIIVRCGKRRTKTSSPKSLSSVTRILPSCHAKSSNPSSGLQGSISRAKQTSCPRSAKKIRKARDDAQTSSRNFMALSLLPPAHVLAHQLQIDTQTASKPVYLRVLEMSILVESFLEYPLPPACLKCVPQQCVDPE